VAGRNFFTVSRSAHQRFTSAVGKIVTVFDIFQLPAKIIPQRDFPQENSLTAFAGHGQGYAGITSSHAPENLLISQCTSSPEKIPG